MNPGRPRILLVEDDANLGLLLRDSLDMAGFAVDLCRDGESGYSACRTHVYDLALLDVVLPKQDGFALARRIRQLDADLPVVFLTARTLKEDRVEGFRIGADDYVTKPFEFEELVLRVRAVLRRTRRGGGEPDAPEVLRVGRFLLDVNVQTLALGDEVRKLTYKETELLRLLARRPNTIVERDVALETIWDNATQYNARSMDVFICRLRKYLRADPSLEIQNVHGVGYRLIVRTRRESPPPAR